MYNFLKVKHSWYQCFLKPSNLKTCFEENNRELATTIDLDWWKKTKMAVKQRRRWLARMKTTNCGWGQWTVWMESFFNGKVNMCTIYVFFMRVYRIRIIYEGSQNIYYLRGYPTMDDKKMIVFVCKPVMMTMIPVIFFTVTKTHTRQ